MLTSNAAPMLARADRTAGDWCDTPAMAVHGRRQQRLAQRAADARLLDEWGADRLAAIEADLVAEDLDLESAWIESINLHQEALDELAYAQLLAEGARYEADAITAAVTRMGDAYALDVEDLPGWGSARVDYADFVSGFRVTDRP